MSYRRLVAIVVLAAVSLLVAIISLRSVAGGESGLGSVEARLRVLEDTQEIRELMMRYARGIDRGDADLVASVFHPDAVNNLGSVPLIGAEAGKRLTAGRKQSQERKQMGQHFIGNELIEVQGDTAFAEHYFMSYMISEKDGDEYTRTRAGRYLDRLERREGKWKVAFRMVVDDWDRFDKVVEAAPGWAHWRRGDLREKDPFAMLRSGAMHETETAIRSKLFGRAP